MSSPGLPAEHLGEFRIAERELAVAREGDADRGVGEDRLVLELRVARPAGIARGRALRAIRGGRLGAGLRLPLSRAPRSFIAGASDSNRLA